MWQKACIVRTTIDIDDDALEEAQRYAPELTKTALVAAALRAFARQEARSDKALIKAGNAPVVLYQTATDMRPTGVVEESHVLPWRTIPYITPRFRP